MFFIGFFLCTNVIDFSLSFPFLLVIKIILSAKITKG
jgi:hypothetical protein